jgi:lipopolysaccharide/colanic/teichoic acid biosynthesis glycosyltransferase
VNASRTYSDIPLTKRFMDIGLTILFAPLLIPLGLLVALLVWIFHGRPIVFAHERPGLDGQAFTLYKFRSMSNARNSQGELKSDEQRLTLFGRLLRGTSLDELPELINVVRGQMSLVGPRPLLMQYLDRYNDEQKRRHHVLPGITGWAQINGRNNVSWTEKFKLDVWYVDNRSVWMDIRILLMTIPRVLFSVGINQPGNATAMEFKGNEDQN